MILIYADLTIDLPHVTSKKGRRAILNSLKERLGRMNASVLDLSGEYPKEARLALAFLALTEADGRDRIMAVERWISNRYPDLCFDLDFEIL